MDKVEKHFKTSIEWFDEHVKEKKDRLNAVNYAIIVVKSWGHSSSLYDAHPSSVSGGFVPEEMKSDFVDRIQFAQAERQIDIVDVP